MRFFSIRPLMFTKKTPMPICLRDLTPEDTDEAALVFFAAVHRGTADVYSAAQRVAWAGVAPAPEAWKKRFDSISGVVAEKDNRMAGFMTIDGEGLIDLAFVHPDYMKKGVGRALYTVIENRAIASGVCLLTTLASDKAKPFFERMGWSVETPNAVVKGGVTLQNYKMFKALPHCPA